MTDTLRAWRARTEPTPAEADALVRAALAPRRRSPVVPLALAAAAACAAVALMGEGGAPSASALRSESQATLAWEPTWSLAYSGEGAVARGPEGVRVDWERGRLEVEVAPGAGVRLVVVTPEGEVRVKGTRFAVERDAAGTRVEVERGRVEVACEGAVEGLDAGGRAACFPASAAGRLERARSLREAGSSADAVVAAVDAGLARDPSPAVRSELVALAVDALFEAGRDAEVVARAEGEVGEGPRRFEIAERAAAAAFRSGGCEAASPWLDALVAERGAARDLERRARCGDATP